MVVLLPIFGLAPIKAVAIERMEEFPSLLTINATEEVTYYRSVNFWIGPTPYDLIRLGAKFTPCMRRDFGIRQAITSQIRDTENRNLIGCCRNEQWVGSTVFEECGAAISMVPITNVTFFEPGIRCINNDSSTNPPGPNFHPCCISITGRCEVMHLRECTARGGVFHEETDTCANVSWHTRHILLHNHVML